MWPLLLSESGSGYPRTSCGAHKSTRSGICLSLSAFGERRESPDPGPEQLPFTWCPRSLPMRSDAGKPLPAGSWPSRHSLPAEHLSTRAPPRSRGQDSNREMILVLTHNSCLIRRLGDWHLLASSALRWHGRCEGSCPPAEPRRRAERAQLQAFTLTGHAAYATVAR